MAAGIAAPQGLVLADPARPSRVLAAYVPEYRLDAVKSRELAGVTDLLYFSLAVNPDGLADATPLRDGRLHELRRRMAHGRLLLSLGGWNHSAGFAGAAATSASRGRLIAQLRGLCREYSLNGIDFDWEHPSGAAENAAYGSLILETKTSFAPQKLLVTAALTPWTLPPRAALQVLDRVHLMAYDQPGPRHATYEGAVKDVEAMVRAGVPRERICLGVPFYGRLMQDKNNALAYADIVKRFAPQGGADEAGGYYFNGPDTVRKKARYARDTGLAGVMAWELGQDVVGAGSLLEVCRTTLLG